METLAYPELFALQDQVLSTVFSVETSFYLTGGTCLHRFHYQRRHSIDLDLFTNDPALFRDDVRTVRETQCLLESKHPALISTSRSQKTRKRKVKQNNDPTPHP